ncbi:hypothetical protein G6F62_008472 [Rhizopus arrhizus]|uniref:BSD domain-containing protein n=1 Tax=Rhizopus oryzae TaxID=64495 RepID=A0A9P6XD02_RHIOR|nr:hypothetical protein G6F23_008263 [Rhizopus arrhizus]KAG1293131.1 hypothetical protein G6F66_006360 [Rhizopus arrhizus]KAG1310967.1 hypothetical protein G6F64_004160 [Rhizopus arrhizus]KAG1325580.1 hypothetical protein G6F62_008472 [Rhizopus arrhizus]KAG1377723.1 hypothetical protein G6F61_006476 [Rhizopus arrhizus]
MDDMYQYAASASAENRPNNNNTNEEDDVILKAFNNMGWSKKWTNLVDTVKKQSEAFVEGTKNDLKEFAQVLTEDAEGEEEQEDNSLELIRGSLASINTVNFSHLKDGLLKTLEQQLPAQVQSTRLPENMDLGQLKEGLIKGTRSAEHYLQNFGTEVVSALKNAVTVVAPDQEQQQKEVASNPRIFATRKEALIAKMQTNEDTYLNEPEEKEEGKSILKTFNDSFKIDEYTEEIARLLNSNSQLQEMMNKLVPVQVSYPVFWQRYFYHAWKIEQDEQKRQLIVQGVKEEEDENEFKWDSDDEDTNTVKEEAKRNSEDTDFIHVSETSSTLQQQTTEDDWINTEKKKKEQDEKNQQEDEDSDWE